MQADPVELPEFDGMRVLTRDLDEWDDAWLVELGIPIRPLLRTYEELESGIIQIDATACPVVRHVVVANVVVHENYEETLVYPAFASGEIRYLGDDPTSLAGGDACTHVDALHDLAAGYVRLECDVDGDQCQYAMGQNQVIING